MPPALEIDYFFNIILKLMSIEWRAVNEGHIPSDASLGWDIPLFVKEGVGEIF